MRSLFARLKLAHKLLICSVAFALPVAVLLYYAIAGFERQIGFTSTEIFGARALQSLCRLTVQLAGPSTRAHPAGAESLIRDIRIAEAGLGPLLPPSFDSDWKTATSSAPLADVNHARARLLHELYAEFPRLAETAKLIIDPELDSYYLAEISLVRLPAVHEALSHDPSAALDPSQLERVRHAASAALAEERRKHAPGLLAEDDVLRDMAALATPAGTTRLESASRLWQNSAAELAFVLQLRAAALKRQELTALILTIGAVAVATLLLFFVLRQVSIPLARATRIAEKIAEGRLGAAEASLARPAMQTYLRHAGTNGRVRDEAIRLLEAFAIMAKRLDSLLQEVRSSCSDVDGSSSAISTALRQFEATVSEQAASTNQVVATTKEISATVGELARNMSAVTAMAKQAAELAVGGLAGLARINDAMQDMLEGASSISRALHTISTQAENINSVLSAITKIANRTNLLSLNAAIEAEKASEYAAGFTTVGLEIRRIADQTAVAALDIEKMLADMQAAVGEGVRATADYARRSQINSETVASVTADLGRSIECTRNLEPHFEAVNSSMQMQAEAAAQILEAMQQLSTVTGNTRESLAQFRDIAEHMRAMVELLQSEVARFSVA